MARREYKLIFAGSMGAGKTTAIAAVSEIPPVSTDVANSDLASHDKATTTTALDYGEVTLESGDKLRLYGTPGQARFDFMWKIVSAGALGAVILVDNSRPDPLADLAEYLRSFDAIVRGHRAVIGVGRTEAHPLPSMEAFHALLDERRLQVPVLSVDVRRREDVLMLLDVLFHQIEVHAEPDGLGHLPESFA
jgi:uncharacterized protein